VIWTSTVYVIDWRPLIGMACLLAQCLNTDSKIRVLFVIMGLVVWKDGSPQDLHQPGLEHAVAKL
jgi:hypothetical protein